jgi:hypothetical protein
MLERLCNGLACDLDELEALCRNVSAGSLCGLGKTAPNPVLSTVKYFREEYEAHRRGICPAGKCKNLILLSASASAAPYAKLPASAIAVPSKT